MRWSSSAIGAICVLAPVAVACLALLVAASETDSPIVETSNAVIAARDGERLRVVFAAEGQPALLFKPRSRAWDWRETSKLVIPVENPGGDPVTVLLRIEDEAGQSLSGKVAAAPQGEGKLELLIDAPSPRAMGMIAGPSLAAAGLRPDALPVTAIEGSIDASRIASVRLGISRPTVPWEIVVGPLRVIAPSEADRAAYRDIVDGFGQFRPGDWPEKVTSTEMLRAKGAEEAQRLARAALQSTTLDRYGGLLSNRGFRATGYFRTERQDGRWWLVTPDGHEFFSIGIDAIAPSGATYVEGREFMFRDLPTRDGELAAHWSETDDRRGLGAQRGRGFDHGRAFDFYTANLERKFGTDWGIRWREVTAARLRAWGFNTIGDWSHPDLTAMHRLPYTVPLSPEGEYAKVSSGEDWWGPMPDPFDPSFVDATDRMARNAAARFAGDPWLIGYSVDNELAWGHSTRAHPQGYYALALGALAAGRQSPAHSAFAAYLQETYGDAERLARAWGIAVRSWDDLDAVGFTLPEAVFENPLVIGDLAAFTRRFAEAYYRTIAKALHRHDPEHLYLGSRFAGQTTEAVEACARWCDIVSFNRYRRSIADDPAEWARFHALGKPGLIGEFHFGSVDRGLFWEGLVGVGRESERGPAYARYLHGVAANPDFVGAHWFQYLDEPLSGRTLDGENGHVGFVTVADTPYEALVSAAREANLAVLRQLGAVGE